MISEFHEEKYMPEPMSGCWLWLRGCHRDGYGTVQDKKKTRLAHRVFFEYYCETIPVGKVVRHKCDTPACVNPKHLQLGTQADNVADSVKRNRVNREPNLRTQGIRNSGAKLTEDAVLELRRLFALGVKTKELGKIFGIHQGTAYCIAYRKLWKHV